MKKIKNAVILAGGLGTRLKPFTDNNPKPMYPIDNIPFIERLVYQLKEFGIEKIVILLGYKAEIIKNYLGNGEKYNISIIYDITPVEYNTMERLNHSKELLDDDFILLYSDNYCPIDFENLVNNYYSHNAYIELSLYTNKDNYTKSNILLDENNLVLNYDYKHEKTNLSGVEIGYSIVNKKIFDLIDAKDKEYSKDLFPKLIKEKKLYATPTEHRYYSIGSFDRMHLTEEFFKEKKVAFLDRDGTLNVKPKKACYVETKDQFKWIDGSIEAVKMLKEHGYITILVTNQPGIAKGILTEENLNEIHKKMQKDLEQHGAKIDKIYYCKHNWDEGCFCRKPNPGLLYQAQKDLSLDLTKCILFGDDQRDIEAANRARCKSILISDNYKLIDAVKDYLKEE